MSVVTVYAIFTYAGQAQRIGTTDGRGTARRLRQYPAALPLHLPLGRRGIETATETPALFKTTADKADA